MDSSVFLLIFIDVAICLFFAIIASIVIVIETIIRDFESKCKKCHECSSDYHVWWNICHGSVYGNCRISCYLRCCTIWPCFCSLSLVLLKFLGLLLILYPQHGQRTPLHFM